MQKQSVEKSKDSETFDSSVAIDEINMVADFLEILPRCSYRSRPVATKKMIPDVPVQDNDSIKDNYCLKVKDSDIFHKENDLKESEVVTPNEITQL